MIVSTSYTDGRDLRPCGMLLRRREEEVAFYPCHELSPLRVEFAPLAINDFGSPSRPPKVVDTFPIAFHFELSLELHNVLPGNARILSILQFIGRQCSTGRRLRTRSDSVCISLAWT
jgi:hypothetical protein